MKEQEKKGDEEKRDKIQGNTIGFYLTRQRDGNHQALQRLKDKAGR